MKTIEQQAKNLWNKTFRDSFEYIDKFFSLYYKKGNFFHLEENGKLISMLFATHHTLKINEKTLPIAYIGSICTVEEERGKGLAPLLLKNAEKELLSMGKHAVILIAAHEGLVPYYEKLGYHLCGKEGIIIKNTFNEDKLKHYTVKKAQTFDFDFIKKVQAQRNNCIIHDENTLKLYTLTDYEVINLYKSEELIAQTVVIPDFTPIEVLDCFCFDRETAEIMSEMLYKEYHKEIRLKHYPTSNQITSTIEMVKPLTPIKTPLQSVFMSLNLDT